jgi:hypothetical protein
MTSIRGNRPVISIIIIIIIIIIIGIVHLHVSGQLNYYDGKPCGIQ